MPTSFVKSKNDHSIESVPYFSAIAWGIFLLFAGFVYLLSGELRGATTALEAASFANAGALDVSTISADEE